MQYELLVTNNYRKVILKVNKKIDIGGEASK